MTSLRNWTVPAALLLVETSWLFLVLAALGAWAGDRGPILSWPGVLLFLSMAAIVHRWMVAMELPDAWGRSVAMVLAVIFIYGTMAVHYGGLGWSARLDGSGLDGVDQARMGLALGTLILLWWRGLRLGAMEDPGEALRSEFLFGLIVLIGAALIQVGGEVDLKVAPVAFVFFGASLAGLALSRLEQPQSSALPPWAHALVWVIGSVLLGGYVLSLLSGSYLSNMASGLFSLVSLTAQILAAIIFLPLEFLITSVVYLFITVLTWFAGDIGVNRPQVGIPDFGEFREAAGSGDGLPSAIVTLVRYSLIGVLVMGVLAFLYWALWIRARQKEEEFGILRESVQTEGADGDLGTLLAGLLPRWRAPQAPHFYALPSGSDPASRVQRAYFQMLNAATRRGQPRLPSETPLEYQSKLLQQFSDTPVDELTDDFDQVRFGRLPVSAEEAERLEEEVDRALGEEHRDPPSNPPPPNQDRDSP